MENLMNCPNCNEPFDTIMRMPRMLITCGHTLCNACLSEYKDSGHPFICPEDRKVKFFYDIYNLQFSPKWLKSFESFLLTLRKHT